MVSFDHLKSRDVADRSLWLAVPQVTDNARVKVRPATDVNPGYQNGLLKMSAGRLRQTAARGAVKKYDVEQSREDDRVLYAQYVIDDWDGIEDSAGKPVPFSRENCAEFLQQLPAWIFDRMRLFCMVPDNFLAPHEVRIDTEALVGNSESGSTGS